MSEMVERVARAIADRIEDEEALPVPMWPTIARVAIAAMREPTEEMTLAGGVAILLSPVHQLTAFEMAAEAWHAMINEMLK